MRWLNESRQGLLASWLVGLTVLLVSMASLLLFTWTDARARERVNALTELRRSAQAVALVADGLIDEDISVGRTLAAGRAVKSLAPHQFLPTLRAQVLLTPQIDSIIVLDHTGAVLGWTGPADLDLTTVTSGAYIKRVLTHGEPTAIDVATSQNGAAVGVGAAVPIHGDGGSVVGVLALTINLDHLAARLSQIELATGQSLALVDSNGRLAMIVGDLRFQFADLSWEQRDRSAVPGVQAALRGETITTEAFRGPITGRSNLAAFVPTPRHGWVVAATWRETDAFAGTQKIARQQLIVFTVLAILAVVSMWSLMRSVVLPLRRLTQHIEHLGGGRFAPITSVTSQNEIGQLASAFNSMGEQLQQTVRDLEGERSQLASILEQLPLGVVVVSAPDGNVVRMNTIGAQLCSRVSGSHTDHNVLAPVGMHHLDGRPYRSGEHPLSRVLHEGVPVRGEEMVVRLPGEPDTLLNINVVPVRDAEGRVATVVQTCEDVTARREADARLHEHGELLRTLFEQFPGAICVVDRAYRFRMMGGQQHFAMALPREQLIGCLMSDVLTEDEFSGYRKDAERAFAGETISVQRIARGRTLQGTIAPLRAADGSIDRILNVAYDITEELARAERASRDEKLRVLGQMASGIAHDLNQVLSLVAGYGDLARDALNSNAPDLASVQEMIRIMERAAYDGGATVKQLLTFARGGENEPQQLIDVGVLLQEVEQLTAPRWRGAVLAGGGRVELVVEARSALTMVGRQSALREMFTNLVFNAVDAMPDGGTITLSAQQRDDRVLINVTDTGCGMSDEVKSRVFEPFFTTKGESGTGLGLAMAFGIIQRHHGEIDITSEVGRGTAFHLSFPIADAVAPPPDDRMVSLPTQACRILVVDDEDRIARLLVSMLQRDGHHAEYVNSGEAAVDLLQAEVFDLVITDLSMGDGMNGWELATAIAALPHSIPVVLATGWGAAIDAAEARARGISAVVAKPYRQGHVRDAIAQALNEHVVEQVRA